MRAASGAAATIPSVARRRLSADARTGVFLALIAFLVYASGLRWGLPHATGPDRVDSWGVDDETPLGPLAEIHNILDPKPDRNLGYPLLYSFTVAAAYAPYMGYLWATGGLAAPAATYPYGLRDPRTSLRMLALIAHLVTTIMAVVVVLGVYDAARVAWGRRTGVVAALFAMTALPMFYYARTGNVDVPMLCFTALACAAFARLVMRRHTTRRAVAIGVFAGLALATKEAALGAFLGIPFVVLAIFRREHPGLAATSWAFWKPHLLALVASFVALGAGSGLFVEPGRYIAHLRFITGRVDVIAGAELAGVRTFAFTAGDNLQYFRALVVDLASILNAGGLVLALAGVAVAVVRRERAALLALPAVTYLLWVFFLLRASQVRYVLPAAILLAGFAAYALLRAWESRWPALRYSAAATGACVLLVQLLRGADLTYQMINDSRFAAAEWIGRNARSGDRLEYFGPSRKLPPLAPSVVTGQAAAYFGMYVPADVGEAKVQEILDGWRERRARFVIAVPDHTSRPGVPHSHTFPPALFADMLEGRRGLRLVAYFRTPPLFPWLPAPRIDYPTANPPIHLFEGR
ncbi:MAG: glycosyltransferase family 39 protein [Gemmatimonadota bacterium]|nr:glycosyltransferase family 39 protein [Gemmatimonadota bacterium]